MASPPVPLHVRVRGTASYNAPAINASNITLGAVTAAQAYMVFPAGKGDLTWQGSVFGLSAPAAGGLTANVWQVAVTVSHFCSDPSSFSSVTAQIYDTNTSAVVASQAFTLSAALITETVTMTSGYPAADVPDLAVRLTWHQVAVGYASVAHAYAEISYSYSDSIGMITAGGTSAVGALAPFVTAPARASLVSAGPVALSLSPSFGQTTTAGNLLLAWTYNNSGPVFDTTCNDPTWTLAGSAGTPGDWRGLWFKSNCRGNETAPVFSTPNTTPMSQLLEFSGARKFDQAGSAYSGQNIVTISAAGSDTASADLVVAIAVISGASLTPQVISTSGTDSSGAVLPVNTSTNASTSGQVPYVFSWAQASLPVGPGVDSITSHMTSAFDFAGGVIASFQALPSTPPASPWWPSPVNRAVTVPIRIGGGSQL